MVLGGVATGNINANEADIITGIIMSIGCASTLDVNASKIGNIKTVEAVLDVSSVKNVINSARQITTKTGG